MPLFIYLFIFLISFLFVLTIDVMVHRQLHAAIDSEISYGNELTDKEAMNELCGGKRLFLCVYMQPVELRSIKKIGLTNT